ncbi:hypothetical protein Tco_0550956 [Tanacetum coccineum]
MTLMMNPKIKNWKNIICTWKRFKRFLQMLLIILDPFFYAEPLQKVQNDDDNYNVFANGREHPEQPESINDTYSDEYGDTNITTDSLDMSTNGVEADQDDADDLAKERDLLASLIDKLKYEIDDNKNHNKLLESSNKTLVDKLKGEIEDFKNKNKSLESSNNHFKEVNNELAKTNQLMFKDIKKFQAELDRYHDVNYALKVEIECAKAIGELISHKLSLEKSFKEMVDDLRYFNSLEHEVDSLKSQLETQKTQFLNEIDRLSKEYYCADHMNAILGVYTKLDEVTNLQCDYLDALEECQSLENELSKRNTTLKFLKHFSNMLLILNLLYNNVKNRLKMTKHGNKKNQLHFKN